MLQRLSFHSPWKRQTEITSWSFSSNICEYFSNQVYMTL